MRALLPVLAAVAAAVAPWPAADAAPPNHGARAAASSVRVVDFSRSCRSSDGCLVRKPSRWAPTMIPRNGTSWVFRNLHWKRWGRSSATATTSARGCAGQVVCDYLTVTMHLRLFARGRTPGRAGKVYRCMAITQTSPNAPEYLYDHYIISGDATQSMSVCD